MSSVGFGLSPASGKAISELVLHGRCRFADLTALRWSRFADTPADWRARLGWLPGADLDLQTTDPAKATP
jgi:sarcosine oxidase subunit beta